MALIVSNNIPSSMQILKRWIPVSATGDKKPAFADYSEERNQLTFSELVTYCNNNPATDFLAGFFIKKSDGYLFVDLDKTGALDPLDPAYNFHMHLYNNSQTYCEISTSGNGFHLLYKVPENYIWTKKNKTNSINLEVYQDHRLMIVSGNIKPNLMMQAEPAYLPDEINYIEEMADDRGVDSGEVRYTPVEHSDSEIIEAMKKADNDGLLARLNDQAMLATLDASSEDLRFVTRIATFTGDYEQIERLWLSHPLARRDWMLDTNPNKQKTLTREDYRKATIEKAVSSLGSYSNKKRIDEIEVSVKKNSDLDDLEMIPRPDGVMSAIGKHYNTSSLHPFAEGEIFAMLNVMSALCAGTYTLSDNPHDRDALGTYSVLIAGSGTGKSFPTKTVNAVLEGMSKINVVTKDGKITTFGDFTKGRFQPQALPASNVAMERIQVENNGTAFYQLQEFAKALKIFEQDHHGEAMRSHLLQCYGGEPVLRKNYAKSDDSRSGVSYSSLTIMGEATPEILNDINRSSINDGFHTRFLYLTYLGAITLPNRQPTEKKVQTYNDALLSLAPLAQVIVDIIESGKKKKVIIPNDVQAYLNAMYDDNVKRRQDEHNSGEDNLTSLLESRNGQKVQILASYCAISQDASNPVITLAHVKYAEYIMFRCSRKLAALYKTGQAGSEAIHGLESIIGKLLIGYLSSKTDESDTLLSKMKRDHKVKLSWLARNTRNKQGFASTQYITSTQKLDNAISSLVKIGVLNLCTMPSKFLIGDKEKTIRAQHYTINLSELMDNFS